MNQPIIRSQRSRHSASCAEGVSVKALSVGSYHEVAAAFQVAEQQDWPTAIATAAKARRHGISFPTILCQKCEQSHNSDINYFFANFANKSLFLLLLYFSVFFFDICRKKEFGRMREECDAKSAGRQACRQSQNITTVTTMMMMMMAVVPTCWRAVAQADV